MQASESFIPLRLAARRLGLPIAWLAAEAEAGRVPCIHASRQKLVDPEQVRQTLRQRAQAEAAERLQEAAHA